MLIGLTGFAQHGKDTAGSLLVDKFAFEKFAFADALRTAVYTLNPIVDVSMTYQGAIDELGYEEAKRRPEVRRLLQVMGTEVGRAIFGENCWVDALDRRRSDSFLERHVITDVRFPNEAAYVKAQGGTMIRVRRLNDDLTPWDNGLGTDHPSERFIEHLPIDYDIESTCVEDLEKTVSTVANFELKLGPFAPKADA